MNRPAVHAQRLRSSRVAAVENAETFCLSYRRSGWKSRARTEKRNVPLIPSLGCTQHTAVTSLHTLGYRTAERRCVLQSRPLQETAQSSAGFQPSPLNLESQF